MTRELPGPPGASGSSERLSAGRLAELACVLEVTARKPGNVHRYADLPGLHFIDFLLSAAAIADPLDRAVSAGVGATVLEAVRATRGFVNTNTNLGIVLLLAPLAAVPEGVGLAEGVESVLARTTVADACVVYRAIRLAQPGGMGEVPDQDLTAEPTMPLRAVMALASSRDTIALQYSNGFRQVLCEGLRALVEARHEGQALEPAIITVYLGLLARYPDSLILRKHGRSLAREVSLRARGVLEAGWPAREEAQRLCNEFDVWLRAPENGFNPGTTADLVTAVLYAGLRDGLICPLFTQKFEGA
jgi:triphosphoribosyl-dephospho-CoA synthase